MNYTGGKRMYDFLVSEVWWMETIVAALITAVVTLIGSFLFYNFKLKSIKDDTGNLISGNKELKVEHKELSKDILMKVDGVKDQLAVKVDSIRELMVVDQNEHKHRYENLSGSQKLLADSIDNLKGFSDEMQKLQFENKFLKRENQQLRQQLNEFNIEQDDLWEHER